jgi:hypothetical protein
MMANMTTPMPQKSAGSEVEPGIRAVAPGPPVKVTTAPGAVVAVVMAVLDEPGTWSR